jgi:MinD-like ATPase involved in chromosome partitioning or flagellar assembly
MALIALTAGKGSPGVTTTAIALAAVWPREAVLADCDAAGGDVALRLPAADGQPLRRDQGLLALAARLRTGTPAGAGCAEHVQRAVGGLPVLTGISNPGQAAALGPLWPAIADALKVGAGDGADTIADCGRHQPGSAADEVLAAADLVLVIARPTVEGLTHLRSTLSALPVPAVGTESVPPVFVVVLDDQFSPRSAEVAEALHAGQVGAPVIGSVAFDPPGAAGLAGTPTRRLDRAPLVVSARRLAIALGTELSARRVASAPPEAPRVEPVAATSAAAYAPADESFDGAHRTADGWTTAAAIGEVH